MVLVVMGGVGGSGVVFPDEEVVDFLTSALITGWRKYVGGKKIHFSGQSAADL